MSKWTEDKEAQLVAGLDKGAEVTQDEVSQKAEALGVTTRSVGAKLRKMGFDVQKAAAAKTSPWTEAEEEQLRAYLVEQSGRHTYAELAGILFDGKYNAKSIQGKVLSMELTENVRKADKVATPKSYTEDEEARFIDMAGNGDSVEKIAEALGKTIQSVRGKALSLSRAVEGFKMPVQEKSFAKEQNDPWADVNVEELTVAEICDKLGKTERGVKTTLTRRGLTCKDYDGAAKKAKAEEKAAASE